MAIKSTNLFSTGKFYYQWGANTIGIYPTPTEAKTIRIHYVAKTTEMESGSDVSDGVLDEHVDVLISYAAMQISKRINTAMYPLFKEEWESLLEETSMGSKVVKEEIIQTSHRDF